MARPNQTPITDLPLEEGRWTLEEFDPEEDGWSGPEDGLHHHLQTDEDPPDPEPDT